jgi:hypothetical protein
VDCEDRVTLIELSRKKIPELDRLYFLAKVLELFLEFLEEDVPSFFLENADRFLDIRQLVVDRLKGNYCAFEPSLLLKQFF